MAQNQTNTHADGEHGDTRLHTAIRRGETERAIGLIQDCADICAQNDYGNTPLHAAAWHGETEVARALIAAILSPKNNHDNTPLRDAIRNDKTETAIALIDAGVDVDVKDGFGYAPLHTAVWRGKTEVARTLINAGANIHATDGPGNTPLHTAAINGYTGVALALVAAGADLSAKNNFCNTPEQEANRNGKTKTEQALKDAAASPPRTDKQRGHVEFWGLLLEEMNNEHGWNARVFNKWSYFDANSGLGSGFGSFGRTMRFTDDKAQVVININKQKSEDWNKAIFNLLEKDRERIEGAVAGYDWVWHQRENVNVCRIAISRNGTILDSKESLDEIRRWMIEYVVQFPSIFRPHLERALANMERRS